MFERRGFPIWSCPFCLVLSPSHSVGMILFWRHIGLSRLTCDFNLRETRRFFFTRTSIAFHKIERRFHVNKCPPSSHNCHQRPCLTIRKPSRAFLQSPLLPIGPRGQAILLRRRRDPTTLFQSQKPMISKSVRTRSLLSPRLRA